MCMCVFLRVLPPCKVKAHSVLVLSLFWLIRIGYNISDKYAKTLCKRRTSAHSCRLLRDFSAHCLDIRWMTGPRFF